MWNALGAHTSNLSNCNTKEFFSVLRASIRVCFWMRFSVNALTRFPNSSSLVDASALVASCGGWNEDWSNLLAATFIRSSYNRVKTVIKISISISIKIKSQNPTTCLTNRQSGFHCKYQLHTLSLSRSVLGCPKFYLISYTISTSDWSACWNLSLHSST